MSEKGTECTTGVGRLVWGHPTKPRPRIERDGPRKGQPSLDANGQPINEISFGIAFPKADFTATVWPAMAAEIATGYPNGVPQRFSYKYVDGDDNRPLNDGKTPYAQREGYAGCYVLAYTQRVNDSFGIPPIYRFNPQSGKYDQVSGDEVKCGDYFAVGTNFKVNVAVGTNTPSIYVNPRGLEFVGYGTAIITGGGVDPNALFGGQQRQLPPGASATPMQQPGAPTMPGMGAQPPQMAPQGAPMAQPGQMPGAQGYAPQQAPMAQPGQMPPPAYDFVHAAPQMAPQGGYAPQQAPMAQPGQMPGAPMMPGIMPPR